jgi:amino acid transporter
MKKMSVFSLVMINVIAVDSLRSLPAGAEYGFSLVFFYLLGAIFFLIPVALIAAELSTAWPETGGLYVWIREAFGKKTGFFVVFWQWLYNVVWYPTIMAFLASTLCYIFMPSLANDKTYMITMILLMFWGATFSNWFGMGLSSKISVLSALVGTLFPMLAIVGLGVAWLWKGNVSEIAFSWQTFFPHFSSIDDYSLLSMVLFGLIGIEMSAVHAGDVKNPKRDYPRALFISAAIIIATLVLSSLAIAIVVPQKNIQLASGLMQAFQFFFVNLHIPFLIIVVAICIMIGSLGTVSAWVLGPIKAIMVAAEDKVIASHYANKNRFQVPTKLLIIQAVIMSILSLFFIFMPSINTAFSLLSTMTSQIALFVYMAMFVAAIRLRVKHPNVKRLYKVPGGIIGLSIISIAALLFCIVVFVIGFFPPSQLSIPALVNYESWLIGGTVIAAILPFFLLRQKKKLVE